MNIIQQDSRTITVSLSNSRWKRLMDLENAYRTAKAIVRGKKQCETAKTMSLEEAIRQLRPL